MGTRRVCEGRGYRNPEDPEDEEADASELKLELVARSFFGGEPKAKPNDWKE